MLIEETDTLKAWLTSHLEPLCDADPEALAKYVLALIRKDKPVQELKKLMNQQMDVFLQNETESFIEMLFKVVETKEYLEPKKSVEKELTITVSDDQKIVEEKKTEEGVTEVAEPRTNKSEPKEDAPAQPAKSRPEEEEGSRRRSRRSPSPPGRRRHNRTPPRRFRDRSPSPRHDRFRPSRRARSRSPPPSSHYRYGGRQRAHSRSPVRYRPRSVDRSPVRRGANSRDSTPTKDEGGYNPSAKKIRCRDYDEKGFCLRGDLCKFDHGVDAVVLEDGSKPGVIGYQPGMPTPMGDAYSLHALTSASVIPYPPPATPAILSVPPPGYLPTIPPTSVKRPFEGDSTDHPNKRFDFNRVGRGGGRGRGRGRGGNQGASRMLAVRNIPAELNTITHLNAHFCRFGNLQNIQVQFEGDPGSALLTFSTNDEANLAFSSSEAVMNNRFIKVFWYMDKGSVKERIGQTGNNHVVMVHGDRVTKTMLNADKSREDEESSKDEKEKAILAIQKNQEMLQTKADLLKKAEEKRKEAVQQQKDLIKSKQDLLSKLIDQQKMLVAKVEKGKATMKLEEKQAIIKLCKDITTSIDKTKADLKTLITISSMKTKTKHEIQKDLLDAEMELFNRQQDGSSETAEIQQRVNLLRLEAAKSGLLPTSRPARGRGAFRGGRGFPPSRGMHRGAAGGFRGGRGGRGRGFTLSPGNNTSLDRRPSRILVSGYELDEKEDLMAHFQKFGEIVEAVEDEATPSVIIKYKTRRFAENAMLSGKTYNDRTLQLSWYTQGTPEPETDTTEFVAEEAEPEDDYTPPQHDYLPPGLQEHEDSLSQGSQDGGGDQDAGDVGDDSDDDNLDHEEGEEEDAHAEDEINEDLLDDDDEAEEAEEERSWKRRKDDED